MGLDWKKRCVQDQTLVAKRKIWETRCGLYRVVMSHIIYAEGVIPDTWYAMEKDFSPDPIWQIISRHRKKEPALKACEKRACEKNSKRKRKKRSP